MAGEITITTTSVVPGADAVIATVTAGGTVTRGMVVYKNSSNAVIAAQADSAATDEIYGIVLADAGTGQKVPVQIGGSITIGATLLAGSTYVLSEDVAGGIKLDVNIGVGDFCSIVGVSTSTSVLQLILSTSSTARTA